MTTQLAPAAGPSEVAMRTAKWIVVVGFGLALGITGAGCASGPVVRAGGSGASVTVDVKNDPVARPGAVRLAAADYVIDGQPVLSLRPGAGGAEDVPDQASWTGALSPGEHVLEATLSYPPRAALGDDMAFQIHQKYSFRAGKAGAVRIRVEEAVAEGSVTASIDQRLGLRIQEY